MKKMLFALLLSLAGVGLSTGQASAWLLCHHCCNSCATICVRPYNAFTPSAFGTICADGCCPLQFGHGYPPPPPPWAFGGPCCGPSMGCAMDGSCGSCTAGAPQGGPAAGTPTSLPQGTLPAFQGPVPAQAPAAPTTGSVGYPMPMGVQAAGYRAPGYYPGYAPMPWMQQPTYPAYWNAGYPNMGR
jgi:hypothetical protein